MKRALVSAGALAASLFVFGAVHGTLNIAMNASAIDVQRAMGRPIMSSFHAAFSIGGLATSACVASSASCPLACDHWYARTCARKPGLVR